MLGFCVMLLAFMNIIYSAKLSHVGIRVQELSFRHAVLSQDIQKLQAHIDQNGSLIAIKARAQELGFTTDYLAITVSASAPVAYTGN